MHLLFRSALSRARCARSLSIAALLMIVAPSLAVAATISIPDALTGSLQEIITTAVTGLIAALIGWVAIVVKNKFNIDIEAKHREALKAFVTRQASGLVAMGAVKLNGVKIEVQSERLAQAANAALVAIPDALKVFGLTPQKIAGMIVDVLPAQPTVSAAQAVALDVANPATPSTGPA